MKLNRNWVAFVMDKFIDNQILNTRKLLDSGIILKNKINILKRPKNSISNL